MYLVVLGGKGLSSVFGGEGWKELSSVLIGIKRKGLSLYT